jgi:hypothetical protein
METYPATAHLTSQLNVMWRMLVMILSGLDSIAATVNADSATATAKYEAVKTAANAQLANSFVNGTFMDVKSASIVDNLGESLELPEGHCAPHIGRVESECCVGHRRSALQSLLRNHKSTLKRILFAVRNCCV